MEDDIELIEPDEFEKRVLEYRTKNKLLNTLVVQLGSWEKLAPHLIKDLFKRMGCKPKINKY